MSNNLLKTSRHCWYYVSQLHAVVVPQANNDIVASTVGVDAQQRRLYNMNLLCFSSNTYNAKVLTLLF